MLIVLGGHLYNVNNQSEYRWHQSPSGVLLANVLVVKYLYSAVEKFAKIPQTYFDHLIENKDSILGPYDWSE
jgi:hypothetical protein